MDRKFKRIRMTISALRLWPHILLMLSSRNRGMVETDLTRWAEIIEYRTPQSTRDFIYFFIRFMTFEEEFRNLFYLRVGKIGWPIRWMCPQLVGLEIWSPRVGPGLFIQHGDNTFVSAESIGANCWIGRHVVIGYSNDTDRPVIGNNVRIYTGAKIIGKVTVGDNAVVGLNTVVIDNVPPNVTVFGVPGKIMGLPGRAFTPKPVSAEPIALSAMERRSNGEV